MIMNNTWYSTNGTCRTSWTRRCSVRARYPFRASSLVTKTMAVCHVKNEYKLIYSARRAFNHPFSKDEVRIIEESRLSDRTLQLWDIGQKRTRFIRLLSCLGTIIIEIFINRPHIAMLSPRSSSG